MADYHIPVLLDEVLEYLSVKTGKKYIDATLGGGGHTREIVKSGGTVLGLDQDFDSIQHVKETFKSEILNKKLILEQGNFAHLQAIAIKNGFDKVSGILFDLGVSTHQLETAGRGFSFNMDGPLDMRKDPANQAVTARDLINAASETELGRIIWDFGEDREFRKIARAIKNAGDLKTTNELAEVILSVRHKSKNDRTHPATRTFQALRIAVNDELATLRESLNQSKSLLEPGGRLLVISFHSLEDRIVKEFFKSEFLIPLTGKPITPKDNETSINPRARSAKLRIAQKI